MKETDTEQVLRITRMEENLNEAAAALKALEKALERYEGVQRQIGELAEYYGSGLWFADLADDEAGKLPQELRRGGLSQDAVYDLLTAWDQMERKLGNRSK